MTSRFVVEVCFALPSKGWLCAAGAIEEGDVAVGMVAEIEGHVPRNRAEVIAVEVLLLKSGELVSVVFDQHAAPWRPFQLEGRTLLLYSTEAS